MIIPKLGFHFNVINKYNYAKKYSAAPRRFSQGSMMKSVGFLLAASICVFPANAQSIDAVLNAASYTTIVAPGTWVAIFGTQLAPGSLAADSVPFPTQLNGVSVSVAGIAARLSYVSAGQINALIPFEVPTSAVLPITTVPLIVANPSGPLPAFSLSLRGTAPAIFTKNQAGTGDALAFDPDFKPISSVGTTPIVLYATGLGPTDPPAASDSLGAGAEPFNRARFVSTILIAGKPAQVLYAGLAPTMHGIYQINVTPDPFVGNDLVVLAGRQSSKPVTLPVPAGTNVTNVTGSIDGLYPVDGTVLTFSALLSAATISAGFDINPGAKPFQVVALAGSVFAVVDIDPTANTWTATYPVPNFCTRLGDFSAAGFVVQDFLSNRAPFAGNIIPLSRLDPNSVQAISGMPFPNIPNVCVAPGTFFSSGSLPVGEHFAIDSTFLPSLLSFGAFSNLNYTPGASSTSFQLYIDKVLVASKSVTFTIP
jgi:uncharacterized protein (TIGR03437 family)